MFLLYYNFGQPFKRKGGQEGEMCVILTLLTFLIQMSHHPKVMDLGELVYLLRSLSCYLSVYVSLFLSRP